MKQTMTIGEMIDEIADRTGMYKKYVKEVLTALEEVILESIRDATPDMKSECRFMNGITIGGYVMPEREVVDPRNQQKIQSPEKYIPYCRFSQTFRKALNELDDELVECEVEEDFGILGESAF